MLLADDGADLDVPVTDIRMYGPDHATPLANHVERVNHDLRDGRKAIFCVGLSRPFQPSSEPAALHWLQVNNIHTQDGAIWQLG